jgi:glycine betaine/choline ABC-type transport system substrate-binding protein
MKVIFSGKLLYSLVLAAIVSMFLYTSCEKEEKECEAVITAKFLSDTTIVVPLTSIVIEKNDVYVDGTTDDNGQFRHTFKLEAILDVNAIIDTSSFDSLVYEFTGQTMIRLKPGETIYRSVFLSP